MFGHSTFRLYRTAMYVGLGLSALVFIIHGIMLHGLELQMKRMSLDQMGLMAALNLIGASVYAARVGGSILKKILRAILTFA